MPQVDVGALQAGSLRQSDPGEREGGKERMIPSGQGMSSASNRAEESAYLRMREVPGGWDGYASQTDMGGRVLPAEAGLLAPPKEGPDHRLSSIHSARLLWGAIALHLNGPRG